MTRKNRGALAQMQRNDRSTSTLVIIALIMIALVMFSQKGDVACDAIGVASLAMAGVLAV